MVSISVLKKTAARLAVFFSVWLGVLPAQDARGQVPAQQATGPVSIDSIRVEGNVRLEDAVILGTTGLQPGTEVTFRDLQRAEKALFSTGQFENIVVEVLGDFGQPVVVVFRVEERDVVRRVTIRGLENADQRMIVDSTGLGPNQPFSPTAVAAAKEMIRAELGKKGIPFARIEERIDPVPDTDGVVDLLLEVTEGNRVTIADIEFIGNDVVSDEDLWGAMQTQPEGFFWFRKGDYEEITYEDDLLVRLPDLYAARGYLDMEVLRDTLIIDPQTGKSRVEVTIDEGPRYRLGFFTVDGNSRFPTDQLRGYFDQEGQGLLSSFGIGGESGPNPVFNNTDFQAATGQVRSLYTNNGYLYIQIAPYLTRQDTVIPGTDDLVVDVGWRIDEGAPAYVRRIDVVGNDYTHERVVREQIFMIPGQVYSEQALISSWQGIQSLGFFEAPMEPPSINPDPQTGEVDIVFRVREKQTGSVNFGTALGGGVGVSGFIGYEQPNLFGQAKSGAVRWDFGRYTNNFTLQYTDPAILQSQISGSATLFNSRDRFFRFSTGERRRLGGSIRFGFPLPRAPRARFFVGYGITRTRYELREGESDQSIFGLPPGTLSTLNLGVTRSTLNHPIFPTAGSRQTIGMDISGGFLGGDGDFTKYTAEAGWYVPAGGLGGGNGAQPTVRFTMGLKAKTGFIVGNAQDFPFEQFWLGGVQFGEQLRGYEETTITPRGYFPRGSRAISDIDRLGSTFLALYGEYAVRLGDNLSFSLFYDAGNVWSDVAAIDPTRLYRGAGIGALLVTPFGPVGLDYAYGFDKPVPGWQLHFRFGQGM